MADKTEKKVQSEYDKAIELLNKEYGKEFIVSGTEIPRYTEAISTGSIQLDDAIGPMGIPITGCMVELIGWESSGKSTITLIAMGIAQKKTGKLVLMISAENSFDPVYAAALGVDLDRIKIVQTNCIEDAYSIAEKLILTKEFCMVVIDSQTALLPRKVIEEGMTKSNLGLAARQTGLGVAKLNSAITKIPCIVIFISQFREKIGVMFGNPETTSNGNALKFYAHIRIEFRKTVKLEDDVATHNETRAKVIKNKFGAPFGKATFDIIYGEGVDSAKEYVEYAVGMDIWQQGGAGWYTMHDGNKIQGLDNAKQMFIDNPEFFEELKALVDTKRLEKIKIVEHEDSIQE